MFQTNTNCEESANVWDFKFLKRILKIPEDQKKLLKNIPGWSNADTYPEKSASLSEDKNVNHLQDKIVQKNINSKADQKFDSKKSKKSCITNNDSVLKELQSNHNNFFPLRKSQSVDSLDKTQPVSNLTFPNRTSSIPNIAKMLSLNSLPCSKKQHDSFATIVDKSSLLGDTTGKTGTCVKKIDIDTQYMDSGVQCQMSQSSQSNLDMSLSKRIGLSSVANNSLNSTASSHETEVATTKKHVIVQKSGKVSALPLNENIVEPNLNLPPSEKICLLVQEKAKDDESFVSLPIPCAQPQTSAKVILQKQNSVPHEVSSAPSISIHADPLLKENNPLSLGKRKRRNDAERLTKKSKSLKQIEIQYSENQIKNMLHIIKILSGL